MKTRQFDHGEATWYLSTSAAAGEDGSVALALRLCDGTRTWRGTLTKAQLRHSRERLLEGLHGELNEKNSLTVATTADGAVELSWEASGATTALGLAKRLHQTATLRAELVAGEGLRELLAEMVDESEALDRACDEATAHGRSLEAQLAELDGVESRLAAAEKTGVAARRASFLELLNRKKRRIAALDEALERREAGVEDTGSRHGSEEDDEEEEDDVEGAKDGDGGGAAAAAQPAGASGGGGAAGAEESEDDEFIKMLNP